MKTTNKNLITAAFLAGIALVATQASARAIPAAMGHPQVGSEQSNFNATDFGITNTAAGPKWYEIGIPYEGTGAGSVSVNLSSSFQCFYVQVTNTGGSVVTGVSGPISLGTPRAVTIGAGDFAKLECRIPNGGTWFGIQAFPN